MQVDSDKLCLLTFGVVFGHASETRRSLVLVSVVGS